MNPLPLSLRKGPVLKIPIDARLPLAIGWGDCIFIAFWRSEPGQCYGQDLVVPSEAQMNGCCVGPRGLEGGGSLN